VTLAPVLAGVILAVAAVGLAPAPAAAEQGSWTATTSQAARDAAVGSIPFEKLSPESRRKVSSVLAGSHLFRRLPVHATACDPDLYLFLVRHPDVVVGIWEALGISDLRLEQRSDGLYRVSDGDGTTGTVEFLYQDHETHVVYSEGKYTGPLLNVPVRGRSLLVLRTGYIREPDGRYYVTSRLDTFTQIDNVGVEFLTRTFQPVMGKVADSNFVQTSAFVGGLSRTAEVNAEGMQRLASRLPRVRPEVREEFAAIAERIAQKTTQQASLQTPVATATAASRPTTTR